MNLFVSRMLRAAKLDAQLYEEVEADESSMAQAIGVVALSSFAAGLGTIAQSGVIGVLLGTILAMVAWYIWAWFTYLIGAKLLPEAQTKADLGQLLRTIGFSSSPGLIRSLGLIPGLGPFVFPIASIWMLVAMVIAIRQALDYKSTVRAVGVCLIGWAIQFVVMMGVFFVVGLFAPVT